MILQAVALILFVMGSSVVQFIVLSILLGWGTAMVYPTFLASIAQYTHPHDRPKSLGVFRFWRDLGYAIGAIITGIIADAIGISASIIFIAGLTAASGLLIQFRMSCNNGNLPKLREWLFGKPSQQKELQSTGISA